MGIIVSSCARKKRSSDKYKSNSSLPLALIELNHKTNKSDSIDDLEIDKKHHNYCKDREILALKNNKDLISPFKNNLTYFRPNSPLLFMNNQRNHYNYNNLTASNSKLNLNKKNQKKDNRNELKFAEATTNSQIHKSRSYSQINTGQIDKSDSKIKDTDGNNLLKLIY